MSTLAERINEALRHQVAERREPAARGALLATGTIVVLQLGQALV